MAVDLGTTNTMMYVRGRGIVLSEPSLVTVDSRTRQIRAVGAEAKRALNRGAESIMAVRPVRGGVITDFEPAEEMLSRFMQKACRRNRPHLRLMVMGVPRGSTSLEKRALKQACLSMGARQAFLLEAPMAAAIGAGLPVGEAAGSLVVNIGGGTCEVAVISLGQIVVSRSIRVGGDNFDEAIIKHLRREHGLLIDEQTAEEVRFDIGSTAPMNDALVAKVRGREIHSGLAKTVVLPSAVIREALEKPVAQIVDAVTATLSDVPPELDADIIDRGMLLTGGGSLLRGLKERLRQETQIPVELAELPVTAVAAGSGVSLEGLATDRRFEQEVGARAA